MGEILGKEILYKEGAGHNGQNQHDDASPDHLEQQRLHGLKRWQVTNQQAVVIVLQLAILEVK